MCQCRVEDCDVVKADTPTPSFAWALRGTVQYIVDDHEGMPLMSTADGSVTK